MVLHMDVCEQKGVSWPPPVPECLKDNPWLKVSSQREAEIVQLAALDSTLQWVDSSQTLTRARFCAKESCPTVLPGAHLFHFESGRYLIGRDLARLQGMPIETLMSRSHSGKHISENQMCDLEGNAFSSSVSLAVDVAILMMADCQKHADASSQACALLKTIQRSAGHEHDSSNVEAAEATEATAEGEFEFEL